VPPEEETAHTHDGFYFRTGLGFGWGQVTAKVDDIEATYTGSGWLLDLLFGGTIGNTVVIGGGFLIHEIVDPKLEVNSEEFGDATEELEGGLGVVTLGPFVDFFFGPHDGGHIGSMIGAASIGLEDDDAELSEGWGFSLFGGYDFWVSDEWSLGINGRYMYAKGERKFDTNIATPEGIVVVESPTIVDTAHTFGVMFSALYH